MKEKDKDLMERYLYEAARHVRKEQREEAVMELQELISDMAESAPMEEVLQKLGDPADYARQYREENRYVVGPDYYDNYEWVLKIVIACVLGSSLISAVIQGLQTQGEALLLGMVPNIIGRIIGRFFSEAILSLIASFGAVTLVFAVLERQHVKVELKEKKRWSVKKLKKNAAPKGVWTPGLLGPVPDKRALIQRSDSIVSIIFAVFFGGLFLLAPQLFGAYVFENGELVNTIPVFNLAQWPRILAVLLPAFLICFVDAVIRLVTGRYCKLVLLSNFVSGILQVLLAAVALKGMPFWNQDFPQQVERAFGIRFTANADLLTHFGTAFFSNVILCVIVAAVLLEMGVTVYRTLRFGTDRKKQI